MEDRCVCCGRYVPEGRLVCPLCEAKAYEEEGEHENGTQNVQILRYKD